VRAVAQEPLAVHLQDAAQAPLQVRVERRLDAAGRSRRGRAHALDEVRGQEPARVADEAQPLGAGRRQRPRVERSRSAHALQHLALAAPRSGPAVGIERRRPLRQAGQERGLRGRQVVRGAAEVGPARGLGAHDLVPVRRDAQVQRQDLALAQPVLEAQRQQHLAQLPPRGARPRDQLLHGLLRDGRPAFDEASGTQVVPHGPHQRERINAWMNEEPPVLGRQRGRHQRGRQVVGRERSAPRPVRRQTS
jgi:hypothetical protein